MTLAHPLGLGLGSIRLTETDMTTRRGFLAGMLATGVVPGAGWADVGAPDFLSAGQGADGQNHLVGLSRSGDIRFRLNLPARGHAACAHPIRPVACGFARRPGTFAFVIDCQSGDVLARMEAPSGRHFYGHGAYTVDGAWLFTTENDYETGTGVIGVWDVSAGYTRAAEFPSGGIGPHEIKLTPDGVGLVVANGGIQTHPDTGRVKLNLPDMQPVLTYLDLDGQIKDTVRADAAYRMNSIRHLDVRADGLVAVALQWQGDKADFPPVLALHRRGDPLRLLAGPDRAARDMFGYGGSVAFSGDGSLVAVTSPRGGTAQVFDSGTGAMVRALHLEDVCGLGADGTGFLASTGTGALNWFDAARLESRTHNAILWDNHLVPVRPA